jgi:polyhydroxyalkanoate synthase
METIFDNLNAAAERAADLTSHLFGQFAALQSIHAVEVGTAPKDLVYEDGKVKLFRYRNDTPRTCQTPVLVVYALVNRPYVLDLQPDRSMIRNLLAQGLDVYMIDWGYASKADRYLTIDDYLNGYIDGCVEAIRAQTGQPKVNLVGICQGGTFSTLYASLHPNKVQTLIPIATPIDFSGNEGMLFQWSKSMDVDTIVDAFGTVPDSFMNAGFILVKPFARLEKYASAMDLHETPEKLLNFLRMEQWIFDSPALAGECLRQFVKDLYQNNAFLKGTMRIGKRIASPKNLTMPLLNIYAAQDHIVPPSATIPLNDYVATQDKTLCEIPGGHIGIFVGAKAQRELAPTIAAWLRERDTDTPAPKPTQKKPAHRKASQSRKTQPQSTPSKITQSKSARSAPPQNTKRCKMPLSA